MMWIGCPPPLHGQGQQEYRQAGSFTAGASFGDGDTALALSAGLVFRLADRIGLDVEAAYARKLDFALDLGPPPRLCVIGGQVPVTGRTVSLVPQLVVHVLPQSRRLRAYLQADIGAGHVRQRYLSGFPFTGAPDERVELTRSRLTLAISFGGGGGGTGLATARGGRRRAFASPEGRSRISGALHRPIRHAQHAARRLARQLEVLMPSA
jgi:hypothetical protein